MNRKSAEAAIRQLCTLDLDSHVLMPRVLGLLHNIIPSSSNVFFWLNPQGEICGVFDENPQAYSMLPVYTNEFVNKREKDVFSGWKTASRFRKSVDQDSIWRVDRNIFMQSAFYNDFMRHLDYHWGLHRPIRGNGRCYGILQMHRDRSACRFTPQETRHLDTLSAFLEHAFNRPASPPTKDGGVTFTAKPSETILVITDLRGQVQHYSDGAERLCSMLTDWSDKKSTSFSHRLPAALMKVVLDLNKIQQGKRADAPSMQVQNRWGRFAVHGQTLNGNDACGTPAIFVIQVEHFLPLQLRLMDRMEGVVLSARQNEVVFNICGDRSYKQIAEEMNITVNTLVTHKKEVFRKLSVSNRHELKEKMLEL